MMKKRIFASILAISLLLPGFALGQVTPANDDTPKIIEEGTKRSKVMETLSYLTDVIGPRLTNSPSQKRANAWTKDKLASWGLQARVESWGNFGRGWELKRFSASLVEPESIPFHSYPKAWSPGTNGPITSDVVFVDATDAAGLEKYKGKLKGAIVLATPSREVKPGFDPVASRHNDKSLRELADSAESPQGQRGFQPTPEQRAAMEFNSLKQKFYTDEGVAVLIEPSMGTDSGTIRVMGASIPQAPGAPPFGPGAKRAWDKDAPKVIPQVVAATEQYNRIFRLLKQGVKVRMTIDLGVQFYEDDLNGYNTIAEIPGTDLKDEIVMIGAHLDSWHSATGSTDNATGVSVVMEAARIIQSLGLKPRRTIRIGLWTGEEQGLYGSRGYVAQHLAEGGGMGPQAQPFVKKAEYDKFSAYYNLDNGTGQIRGIYMQGNESLRPVFRPWLQPFREWNATTLTVQNTGGTDHQAFDAVGLPGFQFIQDPIEYFGRTWHTTQDVSDRAIEEDLKRSSVIMAAFAYNTAMMNERLPRKPARLAPGMAFRQGPEAMADEMAFAGSGMNFSICGHGLERHEIPPFFPYYLAAAENVAAAE